MRFVSANKSLRDGKNASDIRRIEESKRVKAEKSVLIIITKVPNIYTISIEKKVIKKQ